MSDVYYAMDDSSLEAKKIEFKQYLDEVYCEGHGDGLEASDPTAFEIAFNEWLQNHSEDKDDE